MAQEPKSGSAQGDVPEMLAPAAQQAGQVPFGGDRAVLDEQGAARGRGDHLELPQLRLAR